MSQPTDKPKPVNLSALAEILRLRADLLDNIDDEAETMIHSTPVHQGGPRPWFCDMIGDLCAAGYLDAGEWGEALNKLRDSASMLQEAVEIERQIVDRLLAIVETQQVRQFTGPRAFYYPAPFEGAGHQVSA